MRKLTTLTLPFVFLLFLVGAGPAYEPTTDYHQQTVEGWLVYVSSAFDKDHQVEHDKSLALLRVKLFDITRVVPAPALAELRKVPIWLEVADRKTTCMCYHPSRQWLIDNDLNPDKARSVEIANTKRFLTWSLAQPWMVLHELSHAYHDRVLGFENPEIKAAYDQAVSSHKYESILYFNGKTVRAYALTNAKEFFAENSEAFFGTNDFYPFVRAELQSYDPVTYQLLRKMWGLKE